VQCAHTKTFDALSYPTRIPTEHAAWRYADVMHEGRAARTFTDFLGKLTDEEMVLCETVAAKVGDFTVDEYGRRIVPRAALLRAVNVARHIRYVAKPGSRVFEIGAGSGYVGALLALLGYQYGCTDITQGFYIWQNHLLNLFGTVDEQAIPGVGCGAIAHVPWWRFYYTGARTDADVVTCNTALCEMEESAICFVGQYGRGVMFICDTWGLQVTAASTAATLLARAGHRFFLSDAHAIAFGAGADPTGAIADGRAKTAAEGKHDLAAYDAMVARLNGDLTTPDEDFIAYLKGLA